MLAQLDAGGATRWRRETAVGDERTYDIVELETEGEAQVLELILRCSG